ncbi:MAG: patatin-like phospholipase family protein [Cryobacterium sp.]|nr:patatin-like phospholipase family protein [Oligoflexia bacterium]
MENFKIIRKAVVCILSLHLLGGCASATRHTEPKGSEKAESGTTKKTNNNGSEVYGPFSGSENLPKTKEPVLKSDQITLVFGSGLAHGYTYVGVLRALSELKITVHSIYATEVGALAAALYFTQPNPNRIDWALLRFNEKNLRKPDGKLGFALRSPESDLDEKLHEVFGALRVENFSERLHILVEDAKTSEIFEAKKGDLWRAVRGSLAGANGFAPTLFEGRSIKAAPRKIAEEYRLAHQAEQYPIVVVTAGAEPTELFRKLLEGQNATLISVPLPGLDDLDVKKRNQAAFGGKNAVHQAANEILGLVGRKME